MSGIMLHLDKVTPVTATATALGTLAVVGIGWAFSDYQAWLTFGTGGMPPNWRGYLQNSLFRVLRAFSVDNPRDASHLPADGLSYIATELPQRTGPTPRIMPRPLPHRHVPEPIDPAVRERLHSLAKRYADEYKELIFLDKSITEGRSTDAVYVRPELPGRQKGAHNKVLGDEIAHAHPADNSSHVWLTKADTRKVVEAGWGERFPLASLKIVDEGWTLLYAPRTMNDVEVIETIYKAGIGHLTGQAVE